MKLATLIGFSAILMWSLLALLTTASGTVPPFQLTAMTFTIGSLLGAVSWLWRPNALKSLKQPWPVWTLGICGLFGYHFLYFTALRNAPAVEASLIAYLWPLLIVTGSALMPGEHLRWHHIAGTLLGLAGTVLIITKGGGFSFDARYSFGYLMAALCALTWAGYSLLSRRFSAVPTDTVTGFCIGTALLSLLCHIVLEETTWPQSSAQWAAIAALGLLPVGAAFYAWDFGVKRGNIQALGAASYAAPLLSTFILILFGMAQASLQIIAACLLITCGALLASKDMLRTKQTGQSTPEN
ncbi:DMT family transporter [Pseudochrobactrum sp. MP213Fo]|uniref:aromatic amino acid exporter YddG n=1 Tax=Pseudochrobactrum sp. MP213Fo TaxID=3022250 RepID=UPI003BA0DFF3